MLKDMLGKKRWKINLHTHTTQSDGHRTPEEAAAIYKAAGYDAIALTDHWSYGEGGEIDGLPILSGCEYDLYSEELGVFHIICLCAERLPEGVHRDMSPQEIVNAIHKAGGLAVLAHPAWSLNAPDTVMKIEGFDATEIYNTVSGTGQSFRPDSSLIVDLLGARGRCYPLLATDDAHYYRDYRGMDACKSWIMAECDPADPASVKSAIREGRFYATQGPELHLSRTEKGFRVDCSPVKKIVFASDRCWAPRVFEAEDGGLLRSAEYAPLADETFLRAFVIDEAGRYAWSNLLPL